MSDTQALPITTFYDMMAIRANEPSLLPPLNLHQWRSSNDGPSTVRTRSQPKSNAKARPKQPLLTTDQRG